MAPHSQRPEISPYVFPVLLAAFGLWCFWDGWLTSDPAMQEHALFNRVASAVLLPWALWDFLKVRKRERNADPGGDNHGAPGSTPP